MIAIAWYLLKVIICSGVLLGYYWLALRNKVFHHYNRFYLLCTVILSVLLPFVQINFWQTNSQTTNTIKVIEAISYGNSYITNTIVNTVPLQKVFNWQLLYPISYTLISTILFIGLIKMLFQIHTLLKKYPSQKIEQVTFINTDNEKGTPFSFLKYIFWNKYIDTSTPQGHQIFKHELAHIKEKHTYDKLFVNIVLIVYWLNPFFWLLRKELNLIHEFIADKKAVEDGNTSAFAAMLLQTIYPHHQFTIANNFFYSPIKRRLIMLTKIKNPKVNYLGRILALPIMVLLLAAFTFKVNKHNNHIYKGKKVTVVIDAGHGGERDPGAIGNTGITEKELNLSIAKFIKQYNTNENIVIDLVREDDVYMNPAEKAKIANEKKADLFVSLHVDSDKKLASKSGLSVFVAKNQFPNSEISKVFASSILNEFINNYSLPVIANPMQRQVGIWVLQNVNAPAVLIEAGFITNDRDVAYLQSKEGKEAIAKNILTGIEKYLTQKTNLELAIDTIPKALPTEAQWEKAAIGAENDLKVKQSVSVTSERGKIDFYGDKKNIVSTKESPLYVVDGTIVSKEEMDKLNPNNIEKIDILKGESATKKYGDSGKNGVVIITTKNKVTAVNKQVIAIGLDKMNALYVGLENPVTIAASGFAPEDLIVTMKNGSIEGKEGKYIAKVTNPGTAEMIVETIENGQRKLLGTQTFRVKLMPDPINGKNVSGFDIEPTKVLPKYNENMLYFINGIEATYEDVKKIPATDIHELKMLSEKEAISIYGENGKNGAMLITLRSKSNITLEMINMDADGKNIGKNPYVLIDGKEFIGDFKNVSQDNFKVVRLVGKNKAFELYGDKAKEGAILVKTK